MKYINKDVFWAAMEKQGIRTLYDLAKNLYTVDIYLIINQNHGFNLSTLSFIANVLNINPGSLLLDRKEMGNIE